MHQCQVRKSLFPGLFLHDMWLKAYIGRLVAEFRAEDELTVKWADRPGRVFRVEG